MICIFPDNDIYLKISETDFFSIGILRTGDPDKIVLYGDDRNYFIYHYEIKKTTNIEKLEIKDPVLQRKLIRKIYERL